MTETEADHATESTGRVLGVIGLDDLAPYLRTAGIEPVSSPDLADAVRGVNRAVQQHTERIDVLLLHSPRVTSLIPRICQQVNLTVVGPQQHPAPVADGYSTYALEPGTTVVDVLKHAGVTPDDGIDFDRLPAGLQFDPATGAVVDPANADWSSWIPSQDESDAEDGDVDQEGAGNPWVTAAPRMEPQELFDAEAFQRTLRGGMVRTGEGEVVVTLSGSGGTGKSAMALALAHRAAARGQRVILVDGNLGQPDLAAYLRVADAHLPTMLNATFAGRVQAALVGPDHLNKIRDAKLDKVGFAFLNAPTGEQLRSGQVDASTVFDLVEQARQIADLVIIDTQILETDDPRQIVESLILPILARDGWAVALSALSTAGLSNLIDVMRRIEAADVNQARMMSVLTRVPMTAEANTDRVVRVLRDLSVHLGTVWEDIDVFTRTNIGQPIADLPVIAHILDQVLERVCALPGEAVPYDPHASKPRLRDRIRIPMNRAGRAG